MYNGRHSHSCGIVNDGEYIVVAGGIHGKDSFESGGSSSAEVLELSSKTWHKLPELPKPIYGAVAAKLDPGAPRGKFVLWGATYFGRIVNHVAILS